LSQYGKHLLQVISKSFKWFKDYGAGTICFEQTDKQVEHKQLSLTIYWGR